VKIPIPSKAGVVDENIYFVAGIQLLKKPESFLFDGKISRKYFNITLIM